MPPTTRRQHAQRMGTTHPDGLPEGQLNPPVAKPGVLPPPPPPPSPVDEQRPPTPYPSTHSLPPLQTPVALHHSQYHAPPVAMNAPWYQPHVVPTYSPADATLTYLPRAGPAFLPRAGPTFLPRAGPTFLPRAGPTYLPHTLPTYTPPYSSFLPPRFAHAADTSATQLPPWGYTHCPVTPPLAPVPVDEGDTVALTAGVHTNKKKYPNTEISDGVWQFVVDVNDDHVRRTFTAHTNTTWEDFQNEVYRQFEKPRSEVSLAYRISGVARAMTYLVVENDWLEALDCVKKKVVTARTRAVTMEIRNMIKPQRPHNQGGGRGRGRRNPNRDDDIPPEPSPEVLHQYDCLRELQRYLFCQEHSASTPQPTYCWIEPTKDSLKGGHRQLSYEEMTLWAKHMALGITTKHHPPNVQRNDAPAKKRRTGRPLPPNLHIAVNIAPTHGTIPEAPIASTSISAPIPEGVSEATFSSSTPIPPLSHNVCNPPTIRSRIIVLLKCKELSRLPTTLEVLSLMDLDNPAPDLKYEDAVSELCDLGINDAVELTSLPVELLATMGSFGMDSAHRLQTYAYERLLKPLLETNWGDADSSITEMIRGSLAVKKPEIAMEEEEDDDDFAYVVTDEEEDVADVAAKEEDVAEVSSQAVARLEKVSNVDGEEAPKKRGRSHEPLFQWLDEESVREIESVDEEAWGLDDREGEAAC